METNRRGISPPSTTGRTTSVTRMLFSEIGWIWTSEIWEDVTLPEICSIRQKRMQEQPSVTGMELNCG